MTDTDHYDAIREIWTARYTFPRPDDLLEHLVIHFRQVDVRALPEDVETILLAASSLPHLTEEGPK